MLLIKNIIMKKFFTFLFAGLLTVGLSAQTEQGTMILYGATGLDYTGLTVDDIDPGDLGGMEISTSLMEFDAMGGYFVSDGIAIGVSIGYKSETTSTEYPSNMGGGSSEDTESTMMITPTVRYYIGESGLWAQAGYGFGTITEESSSGGSSNSYETSMTNVAVGAGYALYVTENVSFNPAVTYNMATATQEDAAYDSNGNLVDGVTEMSGISFSLGLAIHLGN